MKKYVRVILKALVAIVFAAALLYTMYIGVEAQSTVIYVLFGLVGAYMIYRAVDAHLVGFKVARIYLKNNRSWSRLGICVLIAAAVFAVDYFILLGLYVKGAEWFCEAFSPYAHGLFE
jgi:uncharacterized membrane protein